MKTESLENFKNLINKWHPNANIEPLIYNGHNNPVKYRCLKCGCIGERSKGKNLWKSKHACLNCNDGEEKEVPQGKLIIEEAFKQNPIMELISYHGHNPCKVKCLRCGRILNRYA